MDAYVEEKSRPFPQMTPVGARVRQVGNLRRLTIGANQTDHTKYSRTKDGAGGRSNFLELLTSFLVLARKQTCVLEQFSAFFS
jgi:hypothetical protein